MPSLSNLIAKHAEPQIVVRGREYAGADLTRLVDADDGFVFAIVQGTSNYDVLISREGQLVRVTCSCPYFRLGYIVCKHLVAVAITVERDGLFRELPQRVRLEAMAASDDLEEEPADDDFDFEFDDEDDDFDDEDEDEDGVVIDGRARFGHPNHARIVEAKPGRESLGEPDPLEEMRLALEGSTTAPGVVSEAESRAPYLVSARERAREEALEKERERLSAAPAGWRDLIQRTEECREQERPSPAGRACRLHYFIGVSANGRRMTVALELGKVTDGHFRVDHRSDHIYSENHFDGLDRQVHAACCEANSVGGYGYAYQYVPAGRPLELPVEDMRLCVPLVGALPRMEVRRQI